MHYKNTLKISDEMGIRLKGMYELLISSNTGSLLSIATTLQIPLIQTQTINTCSGFEFGVSNNLETK